MVGCHCMDIYIYKYKSMVIGCAAAAHAHCGFLWPFKHGARANEVD